MAPLAGRRVLLARHRTPDAIADALAAAGAEVDSVELTRTVPLEPGNRSAVAARLAAGAYAWVVLGSARTLEHLDLTGLPPATRLAAVGPATARAVRERLHREPELVASGSAAALLTEPALAAGPGGAPGDGPGGAPGEAPTPSAAARPDRDPGSAVGPRAVLLPGSAIAGPELADGLHAAGWEVERLAVYTTAPAAPEDLPEGLATAWREGRYDAVVLTAGSSARALAQLLGPTPAGTAVVAIGHPTAAAAERAGLPCRAVASTPTPEGIAAAATDALTDHPASSPREDTHHD